MIISISGAPGSGKSSIAKRLARKLAWPRYYMGGLRRQKAREQGFTLAKYNKLGENDGRTDKEVDDYQKDLGQKEDNFVIEGRTSWYFIPHSFKIYLDVDEKEGAKRIFQHLQGKNERNEDDSLRDEKAVLESSQKRVESDKIRYRKYYNIDVYNHKNYDFYLDTTELTFNDVFQKVFKEVKNKLDSARN